VHHTPSPWQITPVSSFPRSQAPRDPRRNIPCYPTDVPCCHPHSTYLFKSTPSHAYVCPRHSAQIILVHHQQSMGLRSRSVTTDGFAWRVGKCSGSRLQQIQLFVLEKGTGKFDRAFPTGGLSRRWKAKSVRSRDLSQVLPAFVQSTPEERGNLFP